MSTVLWMTGFVLLVMETFAGMVANGFIVFIHFIDWFKSKKLSPNDLILTCLGLARLAGLAVTILDVTLFSIFLYTYTPNVQLTITIMWLFTSNINLWFAACLGVWYLMKIAIFSHPIFLQVKQRVSQLIPWLLLGSVIFSAFITIVVITGWSIRLAIFDLRKSLLNNSSDSAIEIPLSSKYFAITVTVLNFIPSVIFLSSTILLIISLWKHIRHLQHNGIGVRDLNTSVHLSAIKALVSFAVLYLSSFVVSTSQILLDGTPVFFHIMSALYPSGHAVILILINPRLKQAWVRMIHCLRYFE